jgi:ribosomal peptide maturation radical SAM protein 1
MPTIKTPVALVQMPWGAVAQPSIALGILKRTAEKAGFPVDVRYLNIAFAQQIGFERYENISVRSALDPEWFFSAALFGPRGLGSIENGWDDLPSTPAGAALAERLAALTGSDTMCRQIVDDDVPRFIEGCVSGVDWTGYQVVGFTTTFAQTFSSLLLARELKQRYPQLTIVFGGANVDAEMGFELVKAFDWIDYIVHGEGEATFVRLLEQIDAGGDARIPGVSMRRNAEAIPGFADCQMLRDLNDSPMPDYSDYLREVERTQLDRVLQIQLPFESSRGCWWGAKSHCTFCGLNRDTMAFRKKDPARVYDELMALSATSKCLTFNATDNIIDMHYYDELLPRLAEADVDFQLFYEVKSNLRKDHIQKLAAAGVSQIQPGIESLNSEVLRLMRKGVTAIQNIQTLKWCFEYDVEPSWNILYGFPGERASQYEDLARVCRLLFHLPPPVGITPVLFERFSPYHFNASQYRLTLRPFPVYGLLYPKGVDHDRIAYYFDGDWDRDGDPQEYIQPTIDAYKVWVQHWRDNEVLFYYERGPGFATLHDNRPLQDGADLQGRKIVLDAVQSEVYLFCDGIRPLASIVQLVGDRLTPEDTAALLAQFVDNGLMFREGDRYLAMAVRGQSALKQRQRKRAPA